MILTWSQPWRISSRTARRTSVMPSAIPMANVRALQHWERETKSVRTRASLWAAAWTKIGAAAAVARAAGRADGTAGDEQPRARQQPLVGGFLQPPIGAAGVA